MEKAKRTSTVIKESIGYTLIHVITLATIIPIIGLVGYIIVKGSPAISWEFLTAAPTNGMRAGGIFPAIVGTIYLTIGTAL
ncbi:phosphate ABC transporter, permease protein PstA, partial [bacterium]|nr:phosphate ABC transporter, permease protein PstA [bacterium]